MKIVIYAIGQIFARYKDEVNWNDIEALCDKNIEVKKSAVKDYKVSMITPDGLCDMEYDFVAVFSNSFFEEIKRELVGEYSVPKERIISWKEIIEDEEIATVDILSFCRIYFDRIGSKKVLDVGMSCLPKRYLTKNELLLGEKIVLDGILSKGGVVNENLYDNVLKNYTEIEDYYDIAILWNFFEIEEDILRVVNKHARYIVFSLKRNKAIGLKNLQDRLSEFGSVKCISKLEGDFWVIDTEQKDVLEDVSIFVATHKRYNIYKEKPYIPLCVGGYWETGYLTEQEGKNIAYLNQKINECTALYWIWKNTKSAYVGLNHYRRYFYNNEIESIDNYLDLEYLTEIFKEHDIILPKTYPVDKMTMLEQISDSMNPELCKKGHSIIRSKIAQKQPDYLEAFDSVMDGHVIFNCNIFVTRRDILNRYCEWLFSFLIEAAEEIDVEGYDNYSQRVIGFFAERMWTVWLRKNRLRIKELPYVIIR